MMFACKRHKCPRIFFQPQNADETSTKPPQTETAANMLIRSFPLKQRVIEGIKDFKLLTSRTSYCCHCVSL